MGAVKYIPKENIFSDTVLDYLLNNFDLTDNKIFQDLYMELSNILYYFVDEDYIKYLSFTIDIDGIFYNILSDNIITALWFMGEFPDDVIGVLNKNMYISGDKIYKFNNKTKKLVCQKR